MSLNKKTAALIVAGGTGSRMGGNVPKQFMELGGSEIIVHTLNTFASCDFIDGIIVVCHSDYMAHCAELLKSIDKPSVVVCGGKTRQRSVYNGLCAADDYTYVMVHDAVRCLVTEEEIASLHRELIISGSCTLAVRSKDTTKLADSRGYVANTLPRENLWQIQTPQAFLLNELKEAHEYAAKNSFEATDDCSVMEYVNKPIKLVEGRYENIKITTPSDMEIAKLFLKGCK